MRLSSQFLDEIGRIGEMLRFHPTVIWRISLWSVCSQARAPRSVTGNPRFPAAWSCVFSPKRASRSAPDNPRPNPRVAVKQTRAEHRVTSWGETAGRRFRPSREGLCLFGILRRSPRLVWSQAAEHPQKDGGSGARFAYGESIDERQVSAC
ncbi:hypothetical protein THER5_1970 [Bifidobacterium thermacidophilum subsp. thermacidophilum]|uniref:Uncharacterized protein n=1 Tax=Bifidobacterium thermacidophilum subsp. thermacidophilum TaxID=79262 RepID=A0A087E987_9BIFI|nr:hypothetical protein THER5_1970 [Bifidobacterium thermacidophilum subsp. thermacidophilum]